MIFLLFILLQRMFEISNGDATAELQLMTQSKISHSVNILLHTSIRPIFSLRRQFS